MKRPTRRCCHQIIYLLVTLCSLTFRAHAAPAADHLSTFTLQNGTVRVVLQSPLQPVADHPNHVVFYLLPNGSTIEQAMGRPPAADSDSRYSNQVITSQAHRARVLLPHLNITIAYVEADTYSWPAWRNDQPDPNTPILQIVNAVRERVANNIASTATIANGAPSPLPTIDLVAHSGGGSFIWGFLNSAPAIPDYVQHIALLDANYSYDDADHHGDKITTWLQHHPTQRLIVIVYDDRRIILNGKPIVSNTGGTWRATDRMARFFEQKTTFTAGKLNDFQTSSALDGRLFLARHPNSENIILHSETVRRNGFLYAITTGRTTIPAQDLPFAESSNPDD